VIPPAAYLAYTQGHLSLTGIVIAGVSVPGSAPLRCIGPRAGRRPLVFKFSAALDQWARVVSPLAADAEICRHLFVTPEKVEQAERWSAQFGSFGIFASRMLPVVRHLIGIPAGIVRMNYATFSLYTVIGSGVWCTVLCWLGVKAGQDEALMRGELHQITLWAVGVLAMLGTIYYFFVHRYMRRES